MNCKPGDLAIVVSVFTSSSEKFIGRIVKVIRLEPHPYSPMIGDWFVDIQGYLNGGYFNDKHLRPIRPDETPEQSIEAMKLLHQLPKETV